MSSTPIDPKQLPGNTPLRYYRDRRHGFSMLCPDWWHPFDLENGKLFSPQATDPTTFISVEVQDLGTPVTSNDLTELREAFLAGLSKVPGSVLERLESYDIGFLVGIEAHQLYRERRTRRKRWIRLLYKESLQVRLVAQGATEHDFAFWLPCFDPAMTGFIFDGGLPPEPDAQEPGRLQSALGGDRAR